MNLGHIHGLPSEILTSNTLVKLKIVSRSPFDLRDGHIFLPKLKTLILDSVKFFNGQLQMLVSGCPALEELDMANIRFTYGIESVCSASLKTLIIKAASLLPEFSIYAPNLVCLYYSESVAEDYPVVRVNNLVEAHVKLMFIDGQHEIVTAGYNGCTKDNVYQKLGQVQKLFHGICSAKKLYLSPGALQVLDLCETIPVFDNLTFLEIDSTMEIAWHTAPDLLRNCPHLNTLVIKSLLHIVTARCGDACICVPHGDKGRSPVSCPVKRLEIPEYNGLRRELEMIKHFLDYFPCLKELEVYMRDTHRFLHPSVLETNEKMLMRYNALSGRTCSVKFKV